MARAAALVVVVIGLAVACSRGTSGATTVASRVLSLGPATTEALFAIGAGSRTVGRSRYCDYPPEATKLPAVGGIEPDLEAILQLHPDLVVGPSGVWSTRFAKTLAHPVHFERECRDLVATAGRDAVGEVSLADAARLRHEGLQRAADKGQTEQVGHAATHVA